MSIEQEIEDYYRKYNHYGLVRDERETRFREAMTFNLREDQNPPIDYDILVDSQGVSEWMKIEDQLQIGSCGGNARSSVEELAIHHETGETVHLSRMFAYLTAQKLDGLLGRDSGSTIDGGAEASQRYGSCLESLFPYPSRYTTNIPQACWADAETRKLRTFKRMQSYDECLRWLANRIGGIVIGIGWNNTCTPTSDGTIRSYRSGGGGHALALLDWNRQFLENGRPFIEMYNSWSTRWGVHGRAFIAPKVVEYWCENETVIAYSDMDGANIKPRKRTAGLDV